MTKKAETKETKRTPKEVIDLCIKTIELAIPFAAGVAAIWGLDIAAYTAAIGTALIYILKAVKLFVKG